MDTINDMTEGKVSSKMLGFFFPMLLTNLLQQLYSVADTVIVGKGIGDNALAAVGIISAVGLFVIGFSTGLTHGFSVVIAQCYGGADHGKMRNAVQHSVKLCVIISLILTVISEMFLSQILLIMQTDNSIMADTMLYGRIIFGGLIIAVAYNLCSGVLRALGDSKTPFKAIIISSTVNIVLDMFMIFVLRTGVEGAAFATLAAQLVSVIICVIKIRSVKVINDTNAADNNVTMTGELLKNGLPMAFMNSITAIGCIIVQSFINGLGVDYTSAYSVSVKYLNLFMLPSLTAGFAVSSFTGQNYGAKKFDRIRSGVRTGLMISFISYIILGAMMEIFPKELAGFMLSGDKPIEYTVQYLRILGITLIGLNCIFVFRNAVQGMGCPTIPMISGFLEMFMRLAAIFLLITKYDFSAVAYADAAAWIGALLLNVIAYFVIIRKGTIKTE